MPVTPRGSFSVQTRDEGHIATSNGSSLDMESVVVTDTDHGSNECATMPFLGLLWPPP